MISRESLNQEAIKRELLPEETKNNIANETPIDAFRHTAASAVATDTYGASIAQRLGSFQESYSGPNGYEDSGIMDEFNNSVGRGIPGRVVEKPHSGRVNNIAGERLQDIFDQVEEAVRDGITINSVNDPRVDQIRDNLLPGESIPDMLARTGGVVPGPRGTGYSLYDPRGPWQDPNMVDNNVREALAPETSPKPRSRPDPIDPSDPFDPRGKWQTPGAPGDRTGQRGPGGDRPGSQANQDPRGSLGSTASHNTGDSSSHGSTGGTAGSGGNRSGGYNGPAGGNGTGPGPSGGFNSGSPKSGTGGSSSGGMSKSQQNHYDHVKAGQKLGLPILLDLDGNGVKIDERSRSARFVDAGGDGLLHRTAWAGAGSAFGLGQALKRKCRTSPSLTS